MKLVKFPLYPPGMTFALLAVMTCASHSSVFAAKTSTSDSLTSTLKTPKVTQRVLHFPEESFGGLYLISRGNEGNAYGEQEVAVAKGTVKLNVPTGREVLLRANITLLKNPAELDKWSPDGIDSLELKSALLNLGDEQFGTKIFSHVKNLTGLRALRATALEPDDIGVSSLKALKKLEIMSLNVGRLEGSCLKDLQTLPALKDLDISDNPIDLNNLSYIEKFPALKHLGLHRCKINKTAMQHISKCSTLEDLNLTGNPEVADDCCDYLCKMPSLQIMDLVGTKITARGLMKFQGSRNLRTVYISDSAVATDAIGELRRALPHTNIVLKNVRQSPSKDLNRIFAPLPK